MRIASDFRLKDQPAPIIPSLLTPSKNANPPKLIIAKKPVDPRELKHQAEILYNCLLTTLNATQYSSKQDTAQQKTEKIEHIECLLIREIIKDLVPSLDSNTEKETYQYSPKVTHALLALACSDKQLWLKIMAAVSPSKIAVTRNQINTQLIGLRRQPTSSKRLLEHHLKIADSFLEARLNKLGYQDSHANPQKLRTAYMMILTAATLYLFYDTLHAWLYNTSRV